MDYSSARLRSVKQNFGEVKQSVFKDSDRYFRGSIIRSLVIHKGLTFEAIYQKFSDDKKNINHERMKKILMVWKKMDL